MAQQVAVRAPERVTRLVLIGSATTFRKLMGVSELARAVDALSDPVPPQFAREFQVSTIHHPVPDEFLDRAVAESLKLPARVWRAVMAGMLATAPAGALGERGIPTLILWGDRDACLRGRSRRRWWPRFPVRRSRCTRRRGTRSTGSGRRSSCGIWSFVGQAEAR